MLLFAEAHLRQNPREVEDQNQGPWVQTYMRGHEGPEWAWCADFVTFLMRQAAEWMSTDPPIAGSFSCDTLAAQAKERGYFVPEGSARSRAIPPGSLFLNRRTSTDWTHVGLVVEAGELTFTMIEGNTNDEGSREGYEVCMRTCAYGNRDSIVYDNV